MPREASFLTLRSFPTIRSTRREIIKFEPAYRPALRRPLVRVLITAALIAPAIYVPIPFPYKVPLFALLALIITWLQMGSLLTVGLRSVRLVPTVLWGIGAALFVIFGIGDLISPLIEWLAGVEPDYSSYGALEGNFTAAATLLGYALFSAAVAEEIVYRGFLLDQLSAIFGESTAAKAAAVVLGGLIFAVPHASQGIVGITMVALTGMVFGWVFFASARNLWAVMLAHALVDIVGVTKLYLGW